MDKPSEELRQNLEFEAFYSDIDAEKLVNGFEPKDMDDKWRVYFEEGWVYFVRSWTGHYIFAIKLHPTSAGGMNVIESWFNSNKDEYNVSGDSREQGEYLSSLIKNLFGISG